MAIWSGIRVPRLVDSTHLEFMWPFGQPDIWLGTDALRPEARIQPTLEAPPSLEVKAKVMLVAEVKTGRLPVIVVVGAIVSTIHEWP